MERSKPSSCSTRHINPMSGIAKININYLYLNSIIANSRHFNSDTNIGYKKRSAEFYALH
jgi:hypothetical protein